MKEIINDPTLGTLIFNEQADWYETTVQTATDGEVRLTIWTDAFSASDDELIPVRESLLLLLKALPTAFPEFLSHPRLHSVVRFTRDTLSVSTRIARHVYGDGAARNMGNAVTPKPSSRGNCWR